MGNVALAQKNINHPLDKIFGDMTARWPDFPPDSVMHYEKIKKLLDKRTIKEKVRENF